MGSISDFIFSSTAAAVFIVGASLILYYPWTLKVRDIRVLDDGQNTKMNARSYSIICRGYRDEFPMIREVMRAEISVRLGRYIAELFRWYAGDDYGT